MTDEEIKKYIDEKLGKSQQEVTEIAKPVKAPIDINGLFEIWKTSEFKKTDILLVKSDNEHVSFDYANEVKELFERLGFKPIIVTIRANDSFEIVTEEKLNAMGYFRKKED